MSTNNSAATGVSLGYGIAIAVSVTGLISTVVLASYICIRLNANSGGGRRRDESNNQNSALQEPGKIVLGLAEDVIGTYPTIEVGQSRRLPEPNEGPCPICLSDYLVNERLRCVPECNHCFHARCVDEWLQVNGSCPLCRNSPCATPLYESVPLTFHTR